MPKQKSQGFSAAEKAAMQNRAKELVAEARAGKNRAQGERDVQAAIAKMKEPDKAIAKKLHALITKHTPNLMPKTWYGMPAYAVGDKVVCFFQNASKFKYRYSTLGFQDAAKLDDGPMWPVAFALKKLGAAEEAKIASLLKKAVR
jgi:uncharacterized protein YdhG (YjbR/CyaY superfamily)